MLQIPKEFKLNNGHSIPAIGLGTFAVNDTGSVKEVVRSAIIDNGYRHIDTARYYNNEEDIGEALQSILKEGKIKREELFITTKIFNDEKEKGQIEPRVKDSLKKLQLDYVDLVLIHWPVGRYDAATGKFVQTPLYETWAEFEDCCKKGLCKSIGVSNFGVQLLLDLLSYCKIRPAVNQIEIHPYLSQVDLVKFCQDQGIVLEAYSPLGSFGTPETGECEENILEDKVIKELSAKYKKSPGQIVLNWGLKRDYVILPKTARKERLAENFGARSFVMDKEDYDKITSLNKNLKRFDTKYWESHNYLPIFA